MLTTILYLKNLFRKIQLLSREILIYTFHLSWAKSPGGGGEGNFLIRYETSAEVILTENDRLFWNIQSKERPKDGLKSQTVQSRLEAAVKHDSIDTASELLSETLVEACKEAGLKVRGMQQN